MGEAGWRPWRISSSWSPPGDDSSLQLGRRSWWLQATPSATPAAGRKAHEGQVAQLTWDRCSKGVTPGPVLVGLVTWLAFLAPTREKTARCIPHVVHKKVPHCSCNSCLLAPLRMTKEVEPCRAQSEHGRAPTPPTPGCLSACQCPKPTCKHQFNHQALRSSGSL